MKTYSIEDKYITVGVCEDVFRLIDVDSFMGIGTDEGMAREVARNVVRAFMSFYPIASEIFPDLTEAEYRNCLPAEVSAVMMGVINYAFGQLAGVSEEKKAQ